MLRLAIASAPATVANVGPGFDVFAFALGGPRDVVRLERVSRPGVRMAGIDGDGGRLPWQTRKNVVSAVVSRMASEAGIRFGIEARLAKGLPLNSGLGSSAASAVAAVLAANVLFGRPFGLERLLDFARYGEAVACGTAHADNVAAALYGGFVVIRDGSPADIIRVRPKKTVFTALAHPHFDLSTRQARSVLPKEVPLADMSRNLSQAAALVIALIGGDLRQLGSALMGDNVVEPVRAGLIPGYDAVRQAALASGAAGVAISGSGPTLFAVAGTRAAAGRASRAMAAAWRRIGIGSDIFIDRLGAPGGRIIRVA